MPNQAAGKASTSLRHRTYDQVDVRARPQGLSVINKLLVAAILTAVAFAVLETEATVSQRFAYAFWIAEGAFGALFLCEYIVRVWIAPEGDPTVSPWRARIRFASSFAGLADLLVVVLSFASFGGSSALLLRLVRLGRILRLAKLGRMSKALDHIVEAVTSRREELLLSVMAGLVLMLIAATALYLAEGSVQPDKFGSIPRALWWAVATMTTIGYGDVFPVTPIGKVLASVVALISIGLVAMPTGILAAAFSDAVQKHKTKRIRAD